MMNAGIDIADYGGGPKNRNDWWFVSALIFITALVFLRSCSLPLLDGWDDNVHVTDNRRLALTIDNLLAWWRRPFYGLYMPLTMWSYMLDYALWGLDGRGYHLQSLVWHILTVLAVFKCFRFLGVRPWTAFIFCAVFAVHPQRVEPVVWVSGRKDVMCAAAYFWSLYLYLRTPRDKWPVGAFVLFLAAMLSKSMAISLPFILLFLEFSRRRSFNPAPHFKRLWPFVAVSVVYVPLSLAAGNINPHRLGRGLAGRLFTAVHNFFWYTGGAIIPSRPNPLQPEVGMDWTLAIKLAAVSLLVLMALVVLIRTWGRQAFVYRVLPWLLSLGVAIAPVSGLVLLGAIDHADRYGYIPAAFVCFGLAVMMDWLVSAWGGQLLSTPFRKLVAGLVAAGYIVVLICLTLTYIPAWRDCRSLWNWSCAASNPNPMSYWFLGLTGLRKDDQAVCAEAGRFFLESNLKPGLPDSIRVANHVRGSFLLGMVLAKRGKPDAALRVLSPIRPMINQRSVNTPGVVADMRAAMAECHYTLGHDPEAAACFTEAAEFLPPNDCRHYFYLGLAEFIRKNPDLAEAFFIQALKLNPGHAPSLRNLEKLRSTRTGCSTAPSPKEKP